MAVSGGGSREWNTYEEKGALVRSRSAIARVRVPGQAPLPLRPLEGLQVLHDILDLLAR